MSDPGIVLDAIHTDADDLDKLSRAIYVATGDLDKAEAAWDEVLDKVTADLEEEFADAGRKSVPEHTALSAARRSDRLAYQNYRAAKRKVDRLSSQLQAKKAALNGRQSELAALRDENKLPSYAEDRRPGHTFGAVRA